MRKAVRLVFKPGSHEEIDGQLFAAMVRKAKGPEPPDDELLLNRLSSISAQHIADSRPLVEKMATNGFKTHHTVPMLQKASLNRSTLAPEAS